MEIPDWTQNEILLIKDLSIEYNKITINIWADDEVLENKKRLKFMSLFLFSKEVQREHLAHSLH